MTSSTHEGPVALVLGGGGARGAYEALIKLGENDATDWVNGSHDLDELWQVGPL